MTQTAQQLTLQDEREIAALIVRYGTGIDSRDWELFRSCFAEDVRADYGAFGVWSSAAEITAVMEEMHAPMGATLHRMSNIVIAAAAGGAVARTYVDALLTGRDPAEPVHQGIGYYDDRLVKTDAGWKIKNRRFIAVRIT